MNTTNDEQISEQKPAGQSPKFSIVSTIVSLALFIAVDYVLFRSWSAVALLVTILVLHEGGHFIAMKLLGYQSIKMTFVPFFGGYVSGETSDADKKKKMILVLAGPLPGILIGMVLFFLFRQNNATHLFIPAVSFILLNAFNLLPLLPLDGGQFFQSLYTRASLLIQIVFLYLVVLVALWLMFYTSAFYLVVLIVISARRLYNLHLVLMVRQQLDKQNIRYDTSYNDLTDDEYSAIRDVLVSTDTRFKQKFKPGIPSKNEDVLFEPVQSLLMPYYEEELSLKEQVIFLAVYILSIALPLLQWSFFKGWI